MWTEYRCSISSMLEAQFTAGFLQAASGETQGIASLRVIETVFGPAADVVADVARYSFVFRIGADNVVVVTFLPFEGDSSPCGMCSNGSFESSHYRCKVFSLRT